jgi:SAM-dependent methyltransferase
MKTPTEPLAYPDRFLTPKAAQTYVEAEYSPDSYATAIWALQTPLVKSFLKEARRRDPTARHLDFACGTGRITRLAEEVFPEVDGLDISAAMVDLARASGRHAQFYVGNILESPDLCPGPYGSITTFRFILNIDPPLRVPVLIELHRRLKPDGALIFNMHGNRHSLRHPALLWNRWRNPIDVDGDERLLNDMSRKEVETCLEASGFVVERVYGIGILPQAVYRWPLRSFWRWLDRKLTSVSALNRFCVDLIFVCKKKGSPPR